MEIEALKTVVLVARQGSFAAAARVLNVDPSSVSRIVSNTEQFLGLRLFQRTTRTLTVTEEGELYLQRIAPLLDEFDRARETASQSVQKPSGTLRMTASVAFADVCIVPLLRDFQGLYPEVAIELLPTDETLDLAANGIDLAIRLGPSPSGDLIATKLLSTRYLVCASPGYIAKQGPVVKPQDLSTQNCLRFALPEFRTRWRFRTEDGAKVEVPVSGNTVIANALSLRRAAIDGLGPALLADWLVRDDITSGTLVDMFPNHASTATDFDTAAWALYPSRAYLPRKVRVMIDFLRARLNSRKNAI